MTGEDDREYVQVWAGDRLWQRHKLTGKLLDLLEQGPWCISAEPRDSEHTAVGDVLALVDRHAGLDNWPRGLSGTREHEASQTEATDIGLASLGLELAAGLRVLHDLARQGWTFRRAGRILLARPPAKLASPTEEKQRVRLQLAVDRNEQLEKPSVRSFVRQLERRRLYKGAFYSIFELMRDGAELAAQLSMAASGQCPLEQVIQPYFQFIEDKERCEHTGIPLREIWRYFRHTWSNPYRSIPGRSMMVLIRDAAAAAHPVIGIALLGSPAAQIAVRDSWIGWSPSELLKELRGMVATRADILAQPGHRNVQDRPAEAPGELVDLEVSLREWSAWLFRRLDAALSELYIDDLLERGVITLAQIKQPTDEVLHTLADHSHERREVHEDEAETDRLVRVKTRADEGRRASSKRTGGGPLFVGSETGFEDGNREAASPGEDLSAVDDVNVEVGVWEKQARTPLYQSKRSRTLRELLKIRQELNRNMSGTEDLDAFGRLLTSSRGGRAFKGMVRITKGKQMGISIAESAVCGAIDPYRSILGGKLVSMLLASPEVQEAYRRRYGHVESIIASGMAGHPIRRGAELSLLMTTSLYGSGSSQYNRLWLPTEASGGQEDIRYLALGMTQGFGTSQFSEKTIAAMSILVSRRKEGIKINSLFGEGTNPRLRKARSGLDELGFSSDRLLCHGSPRVVYAIPLVRNLRRLLLELDTRPDYILPQGTPKLTTVRIFRWWLERWLRNRISRPGILERVSEAGRKTYPMTHGARVVLPPLEGEVPAESFQAPRTTQRELF